MIKLSTVLGARDVRRSLRVKPELLNTRSLEKELAGTWESTFLYLFRFLEQAPLSDFPRRKQLVHVYVPVIGSNVYGKLG